MSPNEFSVYQFLKGDITERVRDFVGLEDALKAFVHYTTCVAARMGITERVIITDGWDCIVAEWKKGEGITFPPELKGIPDDNFEIQ